MQKTKLGISVGLAGAAMYFVGAFGGILASVILGGFILVFEEDAWLKKAAVRAVAVVLGFALLSGLIGLVPDFVAFLNDLLGIFGRSVQNAPLNSLIAMLLKALEIVRTVLLIALGIKAVNRQTIAIPVIDEKLGKHMD